MNLATVFSGFPSVVWLHLNLHDVIATSAAFRKDVDVTPLEAFCRAFRFAKSECLRHAPGDSENFAGVDDALVAVADDVLARVEHACVGHAALRRELSKLVRSIKGHRERLVAVKV